jgi:hypothetical protein
VKQRIKSLNRVRRLQKQLYHLSVWRLNMLEAKAAVLEASRDELIEAMGSNPAFRGGVAQLMGRRLNSIEQQISSAAAARSPQAREALDQGGRLRLAERLLEKADTDYRTVSERQLLSELIERTLPRKKSS